MDRVAAISSWSGGKDSCLACYKAMNDGYDVKYLLTFISRESRRGCFHGIESELLSLQAQKIGIPLVQKEVTADMKKYEEEFREAVSGFRAKGFKTVVFGDIYLADMVNWVERVCGDMGVSPVEPLWQRDPMSLVGEFTALGFKTIIVSCQADKLGKEYVGRFLDMDLAAEFKAKGVCPCGENGEFHTLVVDGPIFKEPVRILDAEPVLKEGYWKHWFLDIKKYA
ncbi:MAG: diphthine--ammonia ligase [Candidatus Omnitrophota bacterium]